MEGKEWEMTGFEVEYPAEAEIQKQKREVMEKAFPKPKRLPLTYVFYGSGLLAAASLMVYCVCMLLCMALTQEQERRALTAMMIFPTGYFSFYFLTIGTEEQEGLAELKQTMPYSFLYLVNARMLVTGVTFILLNMAVFPFLIGNGKAFWSISAAGASSLFLMALFSVKVYAQTGRADASAVLFGCWILLGCLGIRFCGPAYLFLTETVPMAVHGTVAMISFVMLFRYFRREEKRIAYHM